MAVRPGFIFKTERILEIKSDNGSSRVFQEEISQRSDGNCVGDGGSLLGWRCSMALVDFGLGGSFETIKKKAPAEAKWLGEVLKMQNKDDGVYGKGPGKAA